jgi:hypothetical protein
VGENLLQTLVTAGKVRSQSPRKLGQGSLEGGSGGSQRLGMDVLRPSM